MLAPPDNTVTILAVFRDRFQLPMEALRPGRIEIATLTRPLYPLRAFERDGGAVVVVDHRYRDLALAALNWRDPSDLVGGLESVAHKLGARLFSGIARTGVVIAAPRAPVEVISATDPRLPAWAQGQFTGDAWVVTDCDGWVLSVAVHKRYDDRLREIAVGTTERARNRGLARSVVAASARAALAEGRAVLYNHAVANYASARVAESVGLRPLGAFHTVMIRRPTGHVGTDAALALA